MNMKTLTLGAGMISAVLMTGCVTAPITFVDKSRPMNPDKYMVIADEVEGQDYQVMAFGVGLDVPGSGQRRAYKRALEKANGADGLIEMAVDMQRLDLPFVSLVTTRVTGTPVKIVK